MLYMQIGHSLAISDHSLKSCSCNMWYFVSLLSWSCSRDSHLLENKLYFWSISTKSNQAQSNLEMLCRPAETSSRLYFYQPIHLAISLAIRYCEVLFNISSNDISSSSIYRHISSYIFYVYFDINLLYNDYTNDYNYIILYYIIFFVIYRHI